MTPGGALSKGCDKYIDELIAERITLNPNFFTDRPISRPMEVGRDTEPEARRWYAMQNDALAVQQVGFCTTDNCKMGCSPDALVGEEGVLELKCPLLKTHVGYKRRNELPAIYRPQCHGQLLITKRQWVDFVSYAIGAEPFIVRVTPDAYTVRLAEALTNFDAQLQAAWDSLCESTERDPVWPPADSPLRQERGPKRIADADGMCVSCGFPVENGVCRKCEFEARNF
jgi:hypothetical protein